MILGQRNPLRSAEDVAFNKSYNVHKALLDTSIKGLGLFQLPAFKELAYSQSLLTEWA
jgi:hypothetical protein